nr:fructose-1,6-bisphosphatase [uncultured Solibaculum sp.]
MGSPKHQFTREELKYLSLLAEKYPTIQDVCTEIINLQATLNLPKGTEHFMSDLHGEYEAFYHILNNCSGVIREKVDLLFSNIMTPNERSEFCTLIYYPEQKLAMFRKAVHDPMVRDEWYKTTLYSLIDLCKLVSSKYPRAKVRRALPPEYSYIIDELLHAQPDEDNNQLVYHQKIIDTILSIDNAEAFIVALATLIKRLAVDRLHIVGDIFDRGPRADSIMDMLMQYHSVDIEWGNHDILWMGAASGSEACIATVVKNSLAYKNFASLENGYGISLRPLTLFAADTYPEETDPAKAALLAISIILFKLEGQIIKRHPEYDMEDRLLLDKIDYSLGQIQLDGQLYLLKDPHFPTVDPRDPYILSDEETAVIRGLKRAFQESERLHRHVQFLYAKGSMYRRFNHNLLFHGCIPLNEDGTLATVTFDGMEMKGRAFMDYSERMARQAYFDNKGLQKQKCCDYMWYLWCGKLSPLFGRAKMTTFERRYLSDPATWEEKKNPYYSHYNSEETCSMILREFDLDTPFSHIINGHVPVRAVEGESPVKANGRLVVIDGGFCKAYQPTTGIAGYTLIYNSHGMRIMSHQSFTSTEKAIGENVDIRSHSDVFETEIARVMVMDTDHGNRVSNKIYDLTLLLLAYRQGVLIPELPKAQGYHIPLPLDSDLID